MKLSELLKTFGSKSHQVEWTEVPSGPISVHVQGESWGLKNVGKLELNKPTKFSLTPPVDYQIAKGWPEGDFYNVNLHPSLKTTSDNWLGYVSYSGKPTATKIAELVNAGKHVYAWGYFEVEDGETNIVLTLPKSL